jgi:hypothetical protein
MLKVEKKRGLSAFGTFLAIFNGKGDFSLSISPFLLFCSCHNSEIFKQFN